MTTCTCPTDAGVLARTRLNGTATHCAFHDPPVAADQAEPLALNGDPLEAELRARLNITPTETTTPPDAA